MTGYAALPTNRGLGENYGTEMTMETETIDKLFLELSQVTTAITAKEAAMRDALDKLAKLGNEPLYGNSNGNVIALQALKDAGFA